MINQPPVDLLIEQLGTDGQPVSRYCLCVVAAKRARQIIDQTAGSNANSKEVLKELAIASKEIAGGKIKCVKD
ncbi:MAG: DNA-directed RNA polymerase subunit omega [Clostridia bacterium]|jgi:DNA-directed RNA polymerase omega subunit|nr:DNA-directed RNA polymerase subunit omega [Clostridia bacterium]